MTTIITTAVFEDLPSILALQKYCYQENAERYNNYAILPITQTQEAIEAEFDRCVFFKAIEDATIVGSIRAYCNDTTCYIIRLFVHPAYQNRGIAKQLLQSIEERFPTVDRYELFTGYKDTKNLAFYQKQGFKIFKEEQRDDGMIFIFLEKMK